MNWDRTKQKTMTNFINRNFNPINLAPVARRCSASKPTVGNSGWVGKGKEAVILNQVRNHKDYSGFTGKKPKLKPIG